MIDEGFDRGALEAAQHVERVARAMAADGVVPCLHRHVGTWIETPDELEQNFTSVPADVLMRGPDTGDLAWAGADPRAFLARHRDRVGAIHVKDIRLGVAARARDECEYYRLATTGSSSTEPGRGDIDLDQPTVADSASAAADWTRPRLERRRIA